MLAWITPMFASVRLLLAVVFGLVAMVASYLPARLDPVVALRS